MQERPNPKRNLRFHYELAPKDPGEKIFIDMDGGLPTFLSLLQEKGFIDKNTDLKEVNLYAILDDIAKSKNKTRITQDDIMAGNLPFEKPQIPHTDKL